MPQKMPWEEDWSQPTSYPGGMTITLPRDPRQVSREDASEARAREAERRAREAADREAEKFTERNKPKLPEGYMMGPDGKTAVRIPGLPPEKGATPPLSPSDLEAVRAEALDKIRLARTLQQRSKDGWFATGFGASTVRKYGGTGAFDVAQDTETLKNAGALTRIMEMAKANGGKNPLTPLSNADFQALASSLSNLDTGQSDEQYQRNVQRVVDLYSRAYQGAGGADLEGDLDPTKRKRKTGTLSISGSSGSPGASGGSPGALPPTIGGIPRIGGPAGPPTMSLATGSARTERDDALSAKLEQMIRSGASVAAMNKALDGQTTVDPQQVARVREYLKKNPGYSGFTNVTRSVDNSLWNRAASSPAAATAVGIADAIVPTKLVLDDVAQGKVDALRKAHPAASFAGTLIGGIPAAAGLEFAAGRALPGALAWAPRIADAAYGAYQGFGNANDGEGATGALIGAATGGVGGEVGRAVTRGVGSAVRGVQNASVDLLRSRGVPMTTGQVIGGIPRAIEDRVGGLPIIGDVIRARRMEGIQAFDRAAFDDGLSPLSRITDPATGQPMAATTGGMVAEPGVDMALAARSRGYANALDGVHVTADAPYIADTRNTIAAGQGLPDPMAGRADYTLDTRVGQSFDNAGGLTGRDFQQAVRGLRRDARAVQDEPYGWDFGNVTRQAEGDLEGLLNRQAPDAVPAYQAANEANRNVEILRGAVSRGRNGARTGQPGYFAPSQLADAASANARRFGGTHGTTNQPFFELSRAGQEVLPSTVPDSGTTGRYAMLALPAALSAGGGGAGYAAGDTQTGSGLGLGLGLLATLAGGRTVQRGIVSALVDRPDLLRRMGNQIYDNAALGGIPLVSAGAQLPALIAPQ